MTPTEQKPIYTFGAVTILAMYGLRELHLSLESKRRVNESKAEAQMYVEKERMHSAAAENSRRMLQSLAAVSQRMSEITQKFVDDDFQEIVKEIKPDD